MKNQAILHRRVIVICFVSTKTHLAFISKMFQISMFEILYSNFDKDHYIDFHWVQCNEPTPLALDNF